MLAYANAEQDFTSEIVPLINPRAPWRVAKVSHAPEYKLSVRFNDGTEGTVSMSRLIHSPNAGVFAALRDQELFSKVMLCYGAVTWPTGVDLAPDAMYDAIRRDGEWIPDVSGT